MTVVMRQPVLLVSSLLLALLATACHAPPSSSGGDPQFDGQTLKLSGGVYADGSGRRGLALLATFRDAQGRGPSQPWTATLSDEEGPLGQPFSYDGAAAGSYAAWWWPDLGLATGQPYTLTLARADGAQLQGRLRASASDGLQPPRVDLSTDGAQLTWEAVPEARSYACRVYSGGQLQLSQSATTPTCDVSGLPPGSYSASVLAFSADLPALSADVTQAPALPAEFHVSEGRIAFARSGGQTGALKASAAGGGISYGRTEPGLALWLSLTRADGTPLDEPWKVQIVGPGLAAEAPLKLTYPASARRFIIWSYDTPALEGHYTVAATSSAGTLSTAFTVGPGPTLATASDVVAAAQPSGGARISWTAIPGAVTYYVSAWAFDGSLVSGQWVTGAEATFPPGTFTAGQSYSVYVAATDADLSATVAPPRITLSENTYFPATLVAQ